MEDRRNNEGDGGERERDAGGARPGLVEALFLVLRSAQQDGETEHEQDVSNDRAGDRRLDHADVALVKRDAGDDQLGRVPEGGVQQSAEPFAHARRQRFGRAPDPARDGNNGDGRANEERRRIREPRPEAKDKRDRDKNEKPVQRRFQVHSIIPSDRTQTAGVARFSTARSATARIKRAQ